MAIITDLVCSNCGTHGIKVIYTRESVGEKASYGKGRRKQEFVRAGVICHVCGNVHLEEKHWKEIKEHLKTYGNKAWNGQKNGGINNRFQVIKFKAMKKDCNGKMTPVKE
jgi:hypothetical protein